MRSFFHFPLSQPPSVPSDYIPMVQNERPFPLVAPQRGRPQPVKTVVVLRYGKMLHEKKSRVNELVSLALDFDRLHFVTYSPTPVFYRRGLFTKIFHVPWIVFYTYLCHVVFFPVITFLEILGLFYCFDNRFRYMFYRFRRYTIS